MLDTRPDAAPGWHGKTALLLAVHYGLRTVAEVLMQEGATIALEDVRVIADEVCAANLGKGVDSLFMKDGARQREVRGSAELHARCSYALTALQTFRRLHPALPPPNALLSAPLLSTERPVPRARGRSLMSTSSK